MSDEIIKGMCIEGQIVDVPADALSDGVFTADPPDPDEPSTMHIDADGCITIDPESQGQAPGTIPEAVQQAAETQPEPSTEIEVSSTGFVGRLVLESQTVRKLVPLRVTRDRTIRMRLPGERPPPDECYHVAEYNVIIRGKQMNHVGMIPDFQPMATWATTDEMKRAGERWITEHWDLIAIMRERGGRNKSTLIGSRGKTRRE